MYYIYGNDPGQPGAFNSRYHPGYRSIGTTFEVYPGVLVPSDLAPTQNGALIWNPGSNLSQLAACKLEDTSPQLYAVSQPYSAIGGGDTFTIQGLGFGADKGSGYVALGTTRLATVSWSDREIVARVRNVTPAFPAGPYQLTVVAANGQQTVNGLTFHVRGSGYNPALYEVGPGKPYDPADHPADGGGAIQHALDDAALSSAPDLVVVYPGASVPFTNPLGFHLENPVIYEPVKLQGIGPGGVYTDGTGVLGSLLDGRGMGGTEAYAEWWRITAGDIWLNRGGWDGSPVDGDGNPRLYEGAVITVYAEDGEFTSGFYASIDGFKIQGGDQQGFPNNLNQVGGGRIPGVPAEVVIQGGGIFVNGYARHLRITNNQIENNGGAYAGGIRLGTPDVAEPFKDNQNDDIVIAHNRIVGNGGTNLAGAIGVFAGAEDYQIVHNDICGNFSAEYGGGISHYGASPGGMIHHNRIYFNRSYDEGGGIMVAGELPADPALLSPGAGPVDVYANLIQGNLANDDGGGLRFLMAGNFPFNVYNNIIVNNVSTHEGGGVSLNDAPDVRFYNNTVMKNITSATAMTSNGLAAPAGFSSSRNSNLLQATLPAGSPPFSDALMFNNIFWDNRAGTWTGGGVAGIGLAGDPSPIFYWDLGVAGNVGELSPTYTLMQVQNGVPDPSNIVGLDPLVVAQYDSSVRVFPWRGNPNFVGADIVAVELPVTLLGDYHLATGSPAINAGVSGADGILAPNQDYDRQPRPSQGRFEMGADEIGSAYPNTPILFPSAAAVQAVKTVVPAAVNLEYLIYLPLVLHNGTMIVPDWGGDTESFIFDEATGIEVLGSGFVHWNGDTFGPDQEVYFTYLGASATATRQDLLLKVGGLTGDGLVGADTYLIDVGYDAAEGTVQVATLSPGDVWQTHATFGGLSFVAGDVYGARATVGGIVEIYQNGLLIGQADLSAGDTPWPYYAGVGRIGLWFEWPVPAMPDGASLTDFGGGTMPW
ncbi:MAG: IPT/TIG domain-containing protein, partial [Anaerolineae bacterium]|nr:IPT/TIG domain-containing protein [Anaerolineae bacterium]